MREMLPAAGGWHHFGDAGPPIFHVVAAASSHSAAAAASRRRVRIYRPRGDGGNARGETARNRNIWLLQTLNYIISSNMPNQSVFGDGIATPPYLLNSADTDYGGTRTAATTLASDTAVATILRRVGVPSAEQNSLEATNNITAFAIAPVRVIDWRHPLLSVLLIGICLLTVAGNCLVVVAVCTKKYLRNPTGYLIVSLAVADLIVGMVIMPLNSLFEMTRHVWLLGLPMCDLFHALDILASTSSIWNLCVISLDRYMAGHDPIGYRDRVSKRRIILAIGFIWVISAGLSFPAIIWWRQSSPQLYNDSQQCLFTDSKLYVVFSALVSFYIPLILILFAYGRVFLIATRHSQSLKSGIKRVQTRRGRQKTAALSRNGTISAENSTMRIHLGRKSPQTKPKKSHSALANVILAATGAGRVDCYLSAPQQLGAVIDAAAATTGGVDSSGRMTPANANGALYKRIAAIAACDSIQSECSSDATAETTDHKSPLAITNSIDSSTFAPRSATVTASHFPPPPQLRTFQSSNSSTALLGTPPRRRSGRSPTASIRTAAGRRASRSSAYSAHTVVSTISSAATLTGGSYSSGVGPRRFFPSNFDAATAAAAAVANDVKFNETSPTYNNEKCSDDDSLSRHGVYIIGQQNGPNNYGGVQSNGYANGSSTMPSITITTNAGAAAPTDAPATGTSTPTSAAFAAARKKGGGMREKSRQMMKYVHEQRAARTLSIVVGVFILCWTPFFVLTPIMVLCKTCIANTDTYFSVITWAGHLNSMLNPLIYSRFSRDFRKAFKQILTCERERTTKKAIRTPLNLMLAQLASIAQVPTPPSGAGSVVSPRVTAPPAPPLRSQLWTQRAQPHSQSNVELSRLTAVALAGSGGDSSPAAQRRVLPSDGTADSSPTLSRAAIAAARRISVPHAAGVLDRSCSSISSLATATPNDGRPPPRMTTTVVYPNTTVTIVQV